MRHSSLFRRALREPRKAGGRAGVLTLLVFSSVALYGQPVSTRAGDVVTGRTALVIGAEAPPPIRHAVEDLASDMTKVFGMRPRVVNALNEAGPVAIVIGDADGVTQSGAPESFSIVAESGGGKQTIRLAGADIRGTIYAIYQFSQEFLGVDPMYYWTDHEPARRASVVVPRDLHEEFPAPVFRYRGWFPNDEDLLTGWASGEAKDHTGISLAVWNKIYETILRLKGNIIVPGTWNFPDEPQMRLAGERGLILTQHHAMPLGVNVARWPKDGPYNFSTHPEILERAWKDAVAVVPANQEVLWSVGLRGLSDVSYASMDPSVQGNDKRLGELISKAIADQMAIVRARFPKAHFVTDLWQEGARLMQEGYLKIPPEVITVWADIGYGYPQDNGMATKGQGVYYHVAMMNGRANQLTEMVPVERIYSELGRYERAGATEYFLVNTSDVRPVVMTIRASMDAVWKGTEGRTADDFYREWATEEYGAEAAPALVQFYKAYFAAPAHTEIFRNATGGPREYGDQLYHTEGRELMLNAMLQTPIAAIPSQAPKWEPPRYVRTSGPEWADATARREITACGEAQPRWDAVWKKAVADEALVPPSRRNFYNMQVLTMAAINRDSNRMLLDVSKAVEDLRADDRVAADDEAQEAIAALGHLEATRKKAEYGKWANWYHGDWLTGVYRTEQTANLFERYIRDPSVPVPPALDWGWEAYYHILHYEGDRSVDVQ